MMSRSRVFSSLLSTRENGILFHVVGSNCNTLACAVAQLYLATPAPKGGRSEWRGHGCGVISLVMDRALHSSFLRLYSVKRAKLLWEQEVYTTFRYSAPRPFFHTFPAEDCQAGLNFADEEEAERFLTAVQRCISDNKAQPQIIRTHSLDSSSGWLLRDKLDRDKLDKTGISSPSEFGAAPPADPDSATEGFPIVHSVQPSQSHASPQTLPRASGQSHPALPLSLRKGPIPPLPALGSCSSTQNLSRSTSIQNFRHLPPWVPPPPSIPAPKAPPLVAIRKAVSFKPERSSPSFAVLKRHRSLYVTGDTAAEIEDNSDCEDHL